MILVDSILDALADKLGERIQGREVSQDFRDADDKGSGISVECMVGESLATLMLTDFTASVTGESARAKWLDAVSDDFIERDMMSAVSLCFITGDSITVPSWNGRGFDNIVVPSDRYAILAANGDEITSLIYEADEKVMDDGTVYTLLQKIALEEYTTVGGERMTGCRYRVFVAEDGEIGAKRLADFPEWDAAYTEEWFVPACDRLLAARYKSFAQDPRNPNTVKGVPICFGASKPIREIHYLLDQMHNEFGLSEKAILADKRMFEVHDDRTGCKRLSIPRGSDRLFMTFKGTGGVDQAPTLHDWSPDIRYQAYLENLERQYQLVEKAVGVAGGVISSHDDMNYQNVDNVRKSQQKTMSFIKRARSRADNYLDHLFYIWETLANFYGIVPTGPFEVVYDWSDDYITTFADRREALIAGEGIGATDAVDYRMFLFNESPEQARERVEEIRAARRVSTSLAGILGMGGEPQPVGGE